MIHKSSLIVVIRPVTILLILVHLFHLEGPFAVRGDPTGGDVATPKLPQIKLTMYAAVGSDQGVSPAKQFPSEEEAFKNEFVSKNGSDYVIYEGVQSFAFSCEADYPITWNTPTSAGDPQKFLSQFMFFYEFRISEVTPTLTVPGNKGYLIYVHVLPYSRVNFGTVGLTCSSVARNPALERTIYVYRLGKDVLENEGKTVTVYATLTDTTAPPTNIPPLVIPCRPSSPDRKISLQKQSSPNPNGTDVLWSPVNPSGTEVTFDPRVGFTLQQNPLGNSVFGLYRCFVTPTEEDSPTDSDLDPNTYHTVHVNVLRETVPRNHNACPGGRDTPFQEKLVVTGNASFKSPTSSSDTVKCCSGNADKPPNLFLRYCNNLLKCEWDREAILKDVSPLKIVNHHFSTPWYSGAIKLQGDCSEAMVLGLSAVVRCVGENVDVLQQYVTLFLPEVKQWQTSLFSGRGVVKGLKLSPFGFLRVYDYENASTAATAGASRQMIIFVGGATSAGERKVPSYLISNDYTLSTLYGGEGSGKDKLSS